MLWHNNCNLVSMEDITILEKVTWTSGEYRKVSYEMFEKKTPWIRTYRTRYYICGVFADINSGINRTEISDRIWDGYWGKMVETRKRYELEP